MLQLKDFLNFDHYLTPSIIRIFYFLQLALVGLFALVNFFAALAAMLQNFALGLLWLAGALVSAAWGGVAARISTEIIMVLFQNNEHLAVIRTRAEGH